MWETFCKMRTRRESIVNWHILFNSDKFKSSVDKSNVVWEKKGVKTKKQTKQNKTATKQNKTEFPIFYLTVKVHWSSTS